LHSDTIAAAALVLEPGCPKAVGYMASMVVATEAGKAGTRCMRAIAKSSWPVLLRVEDWLLLLLLLLLLLSRSVCRESHPAK
jgi:hypothetical protein